MDDGEPLTFLGRWLSPAFDRRYLRLAAGASRPHQDAEWEGALVVVEDGAIELECVRGGRRRFETGAVLWLSGVPLRAMHNPGPGSALVVAVSRRAYGRTTTERDVL
jgi:hypothetical protein